MAKNTEYETNVLKRFVALYSKKEGKEFSLGERRNVQEDGILISQDGTKVFSLELTKITDSRIEKTTAFQIKNTGVGSPYASYGTQEAITTIKRKEELYSNYEDKFLILDAFSSVPFAWLEYWQPIIRYANQTRFAGIHAVGMNKNVSEIMKIK